MSVRNGNTRSRARALAGLALFIGFALAACRLSHPHLGPLPVSGPWPTSSEPYRIQPGDELEIRFFHTPDQNVTLPVRPDGFISLPLVYELRAAGRTAEELRRELVERCSQELKDPEVAVIVRTFSGYVVHVGGEVRQPGVLELKGPRTVLEAVFDSGGFLYTASPKDVLVVRRLEPAGYELVQANLDDVLSGRDGSGNFTLHPFDVVYVPTSPIADVDIWVDQYIRGTIPVNFSYRIDQRPANSD